MRDHGSVHAEPVGEVEGLAGFAVGADDTVRPWPWAADGDLRVSGRRTQDMLGEVFLSQFPRLFTHAGGKGNRSAGLLAAEGIGGRDSCDVMTIRTEYPYQTFDLVPENAERPAYCLWAAYVPEDAECPRTPSRTCHSLSASPTAPLGPGDTTPQVMPSTGGNSHAGPGGQRPSCRTAKNITGGRGAGPTGAANTGLAR
ncbi:hypothetical protein GCM10027074_78400 [Streptomyces deserti]